MGEEDAGGITRAWIISSITPFNPDIEGAVESCADWFGFVAGNALIALPFWAVLNLVCWIF